MANDTIVRGLAPYKEPIQLTVYQAASSAAIYRHMPVMLNSLNMVRCGSAAVDNVLLLGSVVGFLDADKAGLPSDLTTTSAVPYFASAATGIHVLVADHPDQIFVIEEDTGGTALTIETAIGRTCSFTLQATTGSTTTGYCYAVLDRSDVAADTAGSLKIVGITDDTNSDGTRNTPGNYCKWLVKIMRHYMGNDREMVTPS